MLHGIREGVLAVDAKGAINVLNDEARRLLGIDVGRARPARRGRRCPDGRLRRVVTGEVGGHRTSSPSPTSTCSCSTGCRCVVGGRNAGWVVTIRDRTELEALLRQLDSIEGLTTALRAQEHEFSNRLHVLSVLLELGEVEEATALQPPAPGRDGPGQRGDPGPGRLAGRRGPAARQDHGRRGARRRRAPRPGEPARGRTRRGPAHRHGARQPHRQRRRRGGRRPPDRRATIPAGEVVVRSPAPTAPSCCR